jgi:hypothetical protein
MTFCNAATAGTTARNVSGIRPTSLQGQTPQFDDAPFTSGLHL